MDLSLDESQQILLDTFSELLEKECPINHVRDCEDADGFSSTLWAQYCELGANVMGLPESAGGLDMSLLDLGLVATCSGRALAPVPFLEVAAVGRLLAAVAPEDPLLAKIAEGDASVSIALPRPHAAAGTRFASGERTLVPFGALAETVIARRGDTLVAIEAAAANRTTRVKEIGGGALALWSLESATPARTIASGDAALAAFDRATTEWKLLAGFWLTGIAQRALAIGADYARDRIQFGVPIGGFQAIAHPLAECAIRTDGAELLCWEGAWADKEDPERFEMLASMAFAWGSQTSIRTADISLHTHGGYGFSTEYDIQLYYRRARALSSIGGGAQEELQQVAQACFDGSSESASLLGGPN